MSYTTWHTYGYGICTSYIKCSSAEKIKELLHHAPQFEKDVNDWLESNDVSEPTFDNYMEYDEDYNLGIATFLSKVIEEAEGIELTPCNNFEGINFLLYEPRYPWWLPKNESSLTEEKLSKIIAKYVSMITEQEIKTDYYCPENGG